MKPALCILLGLLATGCGLTGGSQSSAPTRQETNQEASDKAVVATATAGATKQSQPQMPTEPVKAKAAAAHAGDIVILFDVPFANENHIADNVVEECSDIGKQFSASVIKYAHSNNLKISSAATLPESGKVVQLSIDNVYSAGNAFIGHRKSATVSARYLVDGKEVAHTEKTRNSGGGFFGGFKGSCSVLAHTVNTLGSDVAKWLKQQTQ
ncbi:hypothetical protein [Shewanella salipaludis]|uniref:Lipoprotein n=1 Tax=Shewanella salipaludis TaxID=2723052 RepID=A0A972FY27_9GAMM|nr:hypothetical protein [Shewanella salipaludis]NMH65353.1 hypothetical protein [Shewanella salipaludis]